MDKLFCVRLKKVRGRPTFTRDRTRCCIRLSVYRWFESTAFTSCAGMTRVKSVVVHNPVTDILADPMKVTILSLIISLSLPIECAATIEAMTLDVARMLTLDNMLFRMTLPTEFPNRP